MFTGIVRERGRVVSIKGGNGGARLRIAAPQTAAEAAVGDSIAIAGVCLTVVAVQDGGVEFDAVAETLRRSSLGRLAPDAEVNVEPALRAGDPLGGHYVQGHVDAVGRVRSVEPEGDGLLLGLDAPPQVLRYCVEKGSVAVEGVSLTIADVDENGFGVALVPHTLSVTTLGALQEGDEVTGAALRVDRDLDRARAVGGRDAGRHALACLDRDGEGGAERRLVALGHRAQAQLVRALLGQRQADQPARVGGHEVDRLGCRELSGDDEITLVLPVGIVDDHDELALTNVVERLLDGRERRGLGLGDGRHRPES